MKTSNASDGESISEIAESELIQFFLLAEAAQSEGWEGNSQTILLARRGRTIRMCSLNARSEGQSDCSP